MLTTLLLTVVHATGYCDEQQSSTSSVLSFGERIEPQYADLSQWPCCAALPPSLLQESTNPGSGAGETYPIVATSLRDREGLKRDTWYFLGYQAAAVVILYAMPESVTGWTDEQKSNYSLSIWWDNVRNPTWDSDDFAINYILHPYWGAPIMFVRGNAAILAKRRSGTPPCYRRCTNLEPRRCSKNPPSRILL